MAAVPWGGRVGAILGAVVFSHWLLDLIVHHGDMPIMPGNAGGLPRMGLGLWEFPLVVIAFELVLLIGGAYFYWRAANRAVRAAGDRENRAGLLAGLIVVAGLVTIGLDLLAI